METASQSAFVADVLTVDEYTERFEEALANDTTSLPPRAANAAHGGGTEAKSSD